MWGAFFFKWFHPRMSHPHSCFLFWCSRKRWTITEVAVPSQVTLGLWAAEELTRDRETTMGEVTAGTDTSDQTTITTILLSLIRPPSALRLWAPERSCMNATSRCTNSPSKWDPSPSTRSDGSLMTEGRWDTLWNHTEILILTWGMDTRTAS